MLPSAGEWLSQPLVVLTVLLSVRISAVFLLTPVLFAVPLPPTARVLLIIAVSTSLALGHANAASHADLALRAHDFGGLALAVLTEAALGAVLALGILLAFGAITFAGTLLDMQIGFGLASVFDPVTHRQLPVLTNAFNQLAVFLFFLMNGHHALMRGIAYSLERFPVGKSWCIEPVFAVLLKKVGSLFSLGFVLAGPVVCCLLLVEFALGAISRNMPQMNMFVVGVPAKIATGSEQTLKDAIKPGLASNSGAVVTATDIPEIVNGVTTPYKTLGTTASVNSEAELNVLFDKLTVGGSNPVAKPYGMEVTLKAPRYT